MNIAVKDSRAYAVDVHIAARMRMARTMAGISQAKMAEALRVARAQYQKYENARDRMSATRLYQVSRILRCSMNYFFEEAPDLDNPSPVKPSEKVDLRRETYEAMKAFNQLPDNLRREFRELMKETLAQIRHERQRKKAVLEAGGEDDGLQVD